MDTKKACFVLMPFKEEFNNPWQFAITPAAIDNGLDPHRADDKRYAGNIITKDITKAIISAEIVVAEMTGQNPNVLYELGLTHAAKKRVIMITQDKNDIPFDLTNIRYIHYNINRLPELRHELSSAIKILLASSDSNEHDFFPQLTILSDNMKSEINRLKNENNELISLAHGITITIEPSFAYIFFNNRYIGISPQTIHVNPYNKKNVLTVFAIQHFEEYKELSQADLKRGSIHITLDKRDPSRFPERVHSWLKYIRLQPNDVVIGRAIATYLAHIGEHDEAVSQLQELLNTCNSWSMIYNGIGHSLLALGRYDAAIIYFSKVRELEDSHLSYFNLACTYSLLRNYEKCINEIEGMFKSEKYLKEIFSIYKRCENPFRSDSDFNNISGDEKYGGRFEILCRKYDEIRKLIGESEDKQT